jgi:penicillin-binding protein 1A
MLPVRMAIPSPVRPVRRTPPRPAPASRRHPLRWLRRLITLLLVLAALCIGAYVYVLQVYAPGLRSEVSHIPALVNAQLAAHHSPYVPRRQISPYLQNAIVSIEDHRFYSHPGVDPVGMVRAAWINLRNDKLDQGGSTLEEQLVKRAIVGDDRSIRAKLRTVVLAWAVDQDFSKHRILELYLNAAYYGQGAYGAEDAARIYFGTDAASLSLPQAAFLAALPQAPSIYGAQPTGAAITYRQHQVLQDMVRDGYISPEQERAALRTPLTFAFPNPR